MVDQETNATDALVTRSRVKTWFMVQFKGYEVVERREVPKVTSKGRLTYDCLWQLRLQDGAKTAMQDERRAKETW